MPPPASDRVNDDLRQITNRFTHKEVEEVQAQGEVAGKYLRRGAGEFFWSRWRAWVVSIFDAEVLVTTCEAKGYVAVACLSLDGKQTSS
jgi:hypothetical protein